jgi:molybdopterin-guanine dinucleotide biosynthesis protein A
MSVIEGVEIVADTPWKGENEKASIFGLRSALYNCSAPFTAVLACDMPFVTGDVMKRLAERNGVLESGRADVVIPVGSEAVGFSPLCAIYERDRCKVVIDDLLETGSLQVRDLIGQMRVQTIEFSTFSDLACAEYLFSNINTPGDLQSATTIWSNRKQTS